MSDATVIIHVRFFNDGTVQEIGERPASLSSQEWFTKLTNAYAMDYMALSGGRGAFKLTPEKLDVAKSATLQ